MRFLVCDDDSVVTHLVTLLIIDYYKENNLGVPNILTFSSGEALLEDKGEKDFVFLDICMDGMNGIDVAAKIKRAHPSSFIFMITSYTEYLDDAMRQHVFRYMLKPITKDKLFANLTDALKEYSSHSSTIEVSTRKGNYFINSSDIIYLESKDRKVFVYTVDDIYESIQPMKHWLSELSPACFFQSHQGYVVNMKCVNFFDKAIIQLCDGRFKAYISKRRYLEFKDAMTLYWHSKK